DVHRPALRRASLGIYRDDELGGISPERLERFFTPLEDRPGHQIVPALREQIVFAPHNLTTDPPFPQIDLVICRNLLIYLKDATQQQILDRFLYALRPGGILWLGPSESPGKRASAFTAVDKHWKVFRNHGRESVMSASRLLLPSH